MNLELTEEDKKNLRIFSKYMKAQGCEKGEMYVGIYDNMDSYKNAFFCRTTRDKIELYPKIENLFDKYADDIDWLMEIFDDVYDFNYGEVILSVNSKENIFKITASYSYYDTDCQGDTFYLTDRFANPEEKNELIEYFDKMFMEGHNEGKIDFNGGGDSGWIEDTLYLGEETEKAPENILDLCYDLLQSNYGGWEINEGSQGSFHLDFDKKTITLDICLNIEAMDEVTTKLPEVKF